MNRALQVEIRKLSGSLALLLLIAVPGLLGVLVLLALVSNPRPVAWQSIFDDFAFPIWAFFLLPMAVTAFATTLANIEHRSGMWDHWLALPVPRWRIFAAKAVVTLAATLLMTALVVGFTLGGGALGGVLRGAMPAGQIPWTAILSDAALLAASAAMLAMVQLWVALWFENFVVSLGFGICGTLIAIAVTITQTTSADYFPWVLPVQVLKAPHPLSPALWGLAGGAACIVAMVLSLQRRRG